MRLLDLLSDPIRLPVALALAGALLRVVYAIVSRVVAPYPRARALVEAVVALWPDVLRAGLQLVAVRTGRPPPTLDALPPDPDAARVTAQVFAELDAVKGERDALAQRVAELAAAQMERRHVVSLDGRVTVVPGGETDEEPAAERPTPATTTRHRIVQPPAEASAEEPDEGTAGREPGTRGAL